MYLETDKMMDSCNHPKDSAKGKGFATTTNFNNVLLLKNAAMTTMLKTLVVNVKPIWIDSTRRSLL